MLTGTLPSLSRAAARELVLGAGGTVRDGVSRRTDYLVVGADPGGKLDDALRLGVRRIDERGLLRLVRSTPTGPGAARRARSA